VTHQAYQTHPTYLAYLAFDWVYLRMLYAASVPWLRM
jgi:hypothetical protein